MAERLRVLGVDPGSRAVGIAVINSRLQWEYSERAHLTDDDLHDRLGYWSRHLAGLLGEWLPAIVVVENPLTTRNMRTVDALARFVGVTIAEARKTRCLTLEYRAREHRKMSVGEGIVTLRRPEELKRMYSLLMKAIDVRGSEVRGNDAMNADTLDALSLAIAGLKEYNRGQRD